MSDTNPNVTDTALARLPVYHPCKDWVTFLVVGKSSDYNAGSLNGIIMPENVDDSMLMVGKIVKRGPDSKIPDEATHIHVRRGDLKAVMMISTNDGFAAANGDSIVLWERYGELILL